MEDAPGDAGHSEPGPSNTTWWPSDFMEEFQSVSLVQQEHNLSGSDSSGNVGQTEPSSQTASQVLWSTGTLSCPIPNGFYSVLPVSRAHVLVISCPTLRN